MSEPRPRAELERIIRETRDGMGDLSAKANRLVGEIEERKRELNRIKPQLLSYSSERHDLQWEYFERLQLDGELPSLPEVDTQRLINATARTERDER